MTDTWPRPPSMSLEGRRALVTGAGRGIGQAASIGLAAAGAEMVLAARSTHELDRLKDHIEAHDGRAEILSVDLSDLDTALPALAEMGPFDILLNNAGMNRPQPFLEVDVESFDTITSLNIKSAFFVAQAVARGMVEAGKKGSIINLGSQMGLVGGAKRSVYCATKFAVEGMTKAMAIELGPHDIRVNTICPTFIETPMTRPFLADEAFKRDVLGRIPLGRLGQVEDLMGAIVFLASDASGLMTGSSLVVDGGWTAI